MLALFAEEERLLLTCTQSGHAMSQDAEKMQIRVVASSKGITISEALS